MGCKGSKKRPMPPPGLELKPLPEEPIPELPEPEVSNEGITNDQVQEAADAILAKIGDEPKIGIICGTGLGKLGDPLENNVEIPYDKIPHFPMCRVVGHDSVAVYGTLRGIPIICFKGRFHLFEGYSIDQVVFPISVMKRLGVKLVIITEAAMALNSNYAVGDIMLLKDHVNFSGFNIIPEIKDEEKLSITFPGIVYCKDLRALAKDAITSSGFQGGVHEGVYVTLGGPNSETIAELNMIKTLGVDAVGVASIYEMLTALQSGMKLVVVCLIAGVAVIDYDSKQKFTIDEVLDTSEKVEKLLQSCIGKFVASVAAEVGGAAPPKEEDKEDEGAKGVVVGGEDDKKKKKSCECKSNPARNK